MNKNIAIIFSFVSGVVIGVTATYKIAEKKYKDIADEEIESVKEAISNREPIDFPVNEEDIDKSESPLAEERAVPLKPDIASYKSVVEKVGYNTISTKNAKPRKNSKKKEVEDEMKELNKEPVFGTDIYTISPDEFGTLNGYGSETYYYTADNYVLDSDMNQVSDYDISSTIGHDPMGHFGEYEDDSVHIRNEDTQTDYEILMSMKTYEEIREE